MRRNRHKLMVIIGWILFLIAFGLFCLQMGYLLFHERYQVEYIDDRLFYIINILFVACMILALILLFRLSKKLLIIGVSVAIIFIMLQSVLLTNSHKKIKNYISVSPNFKNVFAIKENVASSEALYYRSYYGLLARPKEKLEYEIHGEYKIDWLAKDVAVFTYETSDDEVQQFIGTYGDRNNGLSYYYVGAEIQGMWQGNNISVSSGPDGIAVTEEGKTELFEWDNVRQYGTLAIVLQKDNEAIWTIALRENFIVDSDAAAEKEGNISLYKATVEEERPFILQYQHLN